MKIKYFLYTRKSTEDEERQVTSIEAQLVELAEYAKRERLEIVERFVECKSAKSPGSEILVLSSIFCKFFQRLYPQGFVRGHVMLLPSSWLPFVIG